MSKRTRSSAGGAAASAPRQPTPALDRISTPDVDGEEPFVLVPGAAAAAAGGERRERVKGTAEEEADYERGLDAAYRADLLGIELPPVVPPGHRLELVVPESEKPKITFWTLLFKRVENRGALNLLYLTTCLMVCLPLGMMALGYWVLFGSLSEESRLMWSGLLAVLGVNIVALGFGLYAYLDESPDDDAEPETDAQVEAEEKRKKWAAWELEREKEESREDQERLENIRQLQAAKEGGAAATEATPTRRAPRTPRSRSAKKEAAVERDSALSDSPAPAEASASSSRASRGAARSKKAE